MSESSPDTPHPDSWDTPELWEKIAAFADGELSAEECCALLREAMADPDRARCVEHQQKLRELLSGCMDCRKTMRCPDELKRCIEGLADEHCTGSKTNKPPNAEKQRDEASDRFKHPSTLARLSAWLPLAAAAVLFLAALAVFFNAPRGGTAPAPTASLISAARINHFEQRHVRCTSGVIMPVAADTFPDDVTLLGDALADRLDTPLGDMPLDLGSIGYDYRLAGLCTVPGRGAVHIIYASHATDEHGRQRTLSLWIKPYDPQTDPGLEPGVPAVAADESHPHPIVVWRDDRLIYYLVGDAMAEVEKARQYLAQSS